MLKNTFCHLSSIGLKRESFLWANRILCWEDLFSQLSAGQPKIRRLSARAGEELKASRRHYARDDAKYFADRLPAAEIWRLFPDFRHQAAFLDIETTGLAAPEITTIALYDGCRIRHYVNGQTLDRFADDIRGYSLIITYNGKTFDVPMIESFFRIKLDQVHIDLRYILNSLGYSGGLKACEKQMGISRGNLTGVDGWSAVLLWRIYQRDQNIKALETLLAYNIEDVVNLEKLMILAFNRKIARLDHPLIDPIPAPAPPMLTFSADPATIDRLRHTTSMYGSSGY